MGRGGWLTGYDIAKMTRMKETTCALGRGREYPQAYMPVSAAYTGSFQPSAHTEGR